VYVQAVTRERVVDLFKVLSLNTWGGIIEHLMHCGKAFAPGALTQLKTLVWTQLKTLV